jgi:hypothetical protein
LEVAAANSTLEHAAGSSTSDDANEGKVTQEARGGSKGPQELSPSSPRASAAASGAPGALADARSQPHRSSVRWAADAEQPFIDQVVAGGESWHGPNSLALPQAPMFDGSPSPDVPGAGDTACTAASASSPRYRHQAGVHPAPAPATPTSKPNQTAEQHHSAVAPPVLVDAVASGVLSSSLLLPVCERDSAGAVLPNGTPLPAPVISKPTELGSVAASCGRQTSEMCTLPQLTQPSQHGNTSVWHNGPERISRAGSRGRHPLRRVATHLLNPEDSKFRRVWQRCAAAHAWFISG